jgi:plasmid stabilization system protein ParE
MPRLVIAPEARHDLQAIRDYIAKTDPKAARRFVIRLSDMARMPAGDEDWRSGTDA